MCNEWMVVFCFFDYSSLYVCNRWKWNVYQVKSMGEIYKKACVVSMNLVGNLSNVENIPSQCGNNLSKFKMLIYILQL
jgi:hypothetical protein